MRSMFNFLRKELPTGLIPQPEADNDPRNLLYDDIAPMSGDDIPDSGDIEKGSWTLNQGHTTACTCHSTVHAINQVIGVQLSPRYVFHKIKTDSKYASSTLPQGCYMIDSVKFMCNEGIAEYAVCQNVSTEGDKEYIGFTPTITLDESAKRNKGGAYVYVTSSTDDAFKCAQIVRFLFTEQKPVKVGIAWYSSFNAARKGGVVPPTPPTGNHTGHDILAVAWKKIGGVEYIGFRNSWGNGWGDNGRVWIPRKHLKISAGIAFLPPAQVVIPPKVENRDIHLEKYKASELRKALYEKFPLEVEQGAREANTVARAWCGQHWLILVQAISYKGWSIVDVINFLYALSRKKTTTKAYLFDFNKVKV